MFFEIFLEHLCFFKFLLIKSRFRLLNLNRLSTVDKADFLTNGKSAFL